MAITKRQRSLKKWGKQKWRTKSGKKSSITGERYLPTAAIRSLTAAEYAATTRAKRRDKKKGKQFSKQPKKIAAKTRRFRFVLISLIFDSFLVLQLGLLLSYIMFILYL